MLSLLILFTVAQDSDNLEDRLEVNHIQYSDDLEVHLPIALMTISLLGITCYYFYHLRRVLKDITTTSPFLDIDSGSKIDFTIAERGTNSPPPENQQDQQQVQFPQVPEEDDQTTEQQ